MTQLRRVSVFGATGSIGQNTLDLIARDPSNYEVVALTGGRNVAQLAEDAKRLKAQVAVTCFDSCRAELQDHLAGTGIEVASGDEAIVEAASRPADWVMSAIVGAAGLRPGLEALKHGTTLALANKESLVTAGPLLLSQAKAYGAKVLPVDSEHSAIFQALIGEDKSAVERVIITASGGAFRDWPIEKLAQATVSEASSHPNWDMGQRITIDSASMFNKAMEVIETKEFFGFTPEQIEVIVHPESMIHALVGFNDGALMAHVGPADMRHAIGFALNWPARKELPVERLDLAKIGAFTFREACETRYPALSLARRVMDEGGLMGAVFNAAKEAALDHFIAEEIGFLQMSQLVEKTMDRLSLHTSKQNDVMSLDSILDIDRAARLIASETIKTLG